MADISRITLPSGTTYDIKDTVARQMASDGVSFTVCTDASNTPEGVQWSDQYSTVITGTLEASPETKGIFYLAPITTSGNKDVFSEYITVINQNTGSGNLAKFDATFPIVSNGITITKKYDGSIVVNGTATANVNVTLMSQKETPLGTYIITGVPENTAGNNFGVRASAGLQTGQSAQTKNGQPGRFATPSGTTGYVSISCEVASGTTVNNVRCYIKLKRGSDVTPFVPPEETTYSWEKIGTTDIDLSSLGSLAYKDNASGNYTPEGSISQPVFNGTSLTSSGSYTPAGTVSQPTFSGTSSTVTVSGTTKGSISISAASPSNPSEYNFAPGGAVSTPTITVTPNTTTKYVATSSTGGGSVTAGSAATCTLPTLTTSVVDETLTLSWTAGNFTANTPTAVTLPSFSSQTIATGISSASSTQPTFTGDHYNITFTGSSITSTGSFTPKGNVTQPTFTGTQETISVSGTPSGTITQPTFTGTQKAVTVS